MRDDSKLRKGALTISKVEKLLEKVATKVKQEKSNSRALHFQNKFFNELIFKMGVDHNDKVVIDAIIQSSQPKIQSFRQQLKIPTS